MATDSIVPAWTPGTKLEDFPSDPDQLASLIAEWTRERPAVMESVWWYRLPVSTDARNWQWKTLAAVMTGRAPVSRLEVTHSAGMPLDFILINNGEKDEWLPAAVKVWWTSPEPALGDGIAGWNFATNNDTGASFTASSALHGRLLPAGQSMALGWLRFHDATAPPVRTEIERHVPPDPLPQGR